jgi:Concanavalin A-like lectin/glucanases superfamily
MEMKYQSCRWLISITGLVMTLLSLAPARALADIDTGLVAYYPFNGNANDESGQGNHGTVRGPTLTTDRFGNAGRAYAFDGLNDFIVASATNLPTRERTVALWFKATTVVFNPGFMGYGGGGCGTSFFVGIIGSSTYYVTSHCSVNTLSYQYSISPVGAWHHFGITTDSGGTRMYVDGVEVASNTNFIANTIVAGKDLAIGSVPDPNGIAPYSDSNVSYFPGSIDEVRIYNRALSAAEMQELVLDGTQPSVGGSVAGVSPKIVVCRNLTTAQRVVIRNGDGSWDCEAAGLVVAAGHSIQQTVAGRANPSQSSVGGAVTGLTPSKVTCRNTTRRQRVVIEDGARSWDCGAAGLEVMPGDLIVQTVTGVAG